jgi:transcriptional regulator
MYVPKHLRPTESDDVMGFIRQHSFGLLVGTDEAGLPIATHIPMILSERDGQAVLLTHVARPNPLWRSIQPDKQVLAVFSGPHAYVSASWYDHENVPTWNYVAVHVYGRARVLDEAETQPGGRRDLFGRVCAARNARIGWAGNPGGRHPGGL